jgi:hypothetical protein
MKMKETNQGGNNMMSNVYGVLRITLITIMTGMFISGTALAAPSLSGVSGTISDDSTVTITGAGFGSNNGNVKWLGDNIEAGTAGQLISDSNWTSSEDIGGGFTGPVYDKNYSHSGNQSLQFNMSDTEMERNVWGCTLDYDNGAEISEAYITFWVRATYTGSGQWKIMRLSSSPSPSDTDGETMISYWPGVQAYSLMRPINDSYDSRWISTAGEKGTYWLPSDYIPKEKWVRLEIYAKASSGGAMNGTYSYKVHRPNETIEELVNYNGNLMTYDSSIPDRWRYIILGHYMGNGLEGKAWYDDVFVQIGSQARVELGDAPTWKGCTYREVQYPKSWSTGTVSISFNPGNFAAGKTAYLYVVDADGNVNSSGYPVTIGGQPGDPVDPEPEPEPEPQPDETAPNPPSGLRVITN